MPTLQPTPPVKDFGPFVSIDISIAGNQGLVIVPGWFKGIPQYWQIQNFYLILTNDATVANRQVTAEIYRDIKQTNRVEAYVGPALAASSTGSYEMARVSYVSGSATFNCSAAWGFTGSLPEFWADQILKFGVINGVAGDTLTGTLVLRYMNYKYGMLSPHDQGIIFPQGN